MPPKFSLQPVLDYRHSLVESLEIELGQLIQAHHDAYDHLQTLQHLQAQLFIALREQRSGHLNLTTIEFIHIGINQLDRQIEEKIQEIANLKKEIEAKREEIVIAKQDEEIITTLKEKELEEYKAEQARVESKLTDDIYISQAFRNMKQSDFGGTS